MGIHFGHASTKTQVTQKYYKILPTADNGFILAGYTASLAGGQLLGLVIKLDVNGNEQWEKKIYRPYPQYYFP